MNDNNNKTKTTATKQTVNRREGSVKFGPIVTDSLGIHATPELWPCFLEDFLKSFGEFVSKSTVNNKRTGNDLKQSESMFFRPIFAKLSLAKLGQVQNVACRK